VPGVPTPFLAKAHLQFSSTQEVHMLRAWRKRSWAGAWFWVLAHDILDPWKPASPLKPQPNWGPSNFHSGATSPPKSHEIQGSWATRKNLTVNLQYNLYHPKKKCLSFGVGWNILKLKLFCASVSTPIPLLDHVTLDWTKTTPGLHELCSWRVLSVPFDRIQNIAARAQTHFSSPKHGETTVS